MTEKNTTISYLQTYIRAKDYQPERKKDYFLKLSEEVGELAKAIRKNVLRAESGDLKGTIDEELWDVIYYAIALANCYDVDLERVISEKEDMNREKYGHAIRFKSGR